MTIKVLASTDVLTVRAKLPDDTTLDEFIYLTERVGRLANAARQTVDYYNTRTRLQSPILVRVQYGSDYIVALAVATGLSTVIVALSKAVKNLADAAKSSEEAYLAQAQAEKTRAETAQLIQPVDQRRFEYRVLREAVKAIPFEERVSIVADALRDDFPDVAQMLEEDRPGFRTRRDEDYRQRLVATLSELAKRDPTFAVE